MNIKNANGKLIAAMGLPGSGKSSVMSALGTKLEITTFLELEEKEYTEVVKRRDIYGSFTAMTWFRAMRMPNLYEADRLRKQGETVFIDTYYDKLFHFYLHKEGMEWLIRTTDTYFDVIQEITRLDYQFLPDADYLITFELDYDTWVKFLQLRGRKLLDSDEIFLNSYKTQAYFIEAAQQYCKESGCQLIQFQQTFSSLEESASRLHQLLVEHGVV